MIIKIFFAAVAFLTAITGIAQQQLPNDPATRVGKLDNGLTYYIRHNEKPAQRAEFYLATHAGALLEEPDQDGLAHFLEHMCFNGTKNFPNKDLLNWLQSIGASFGGNVNASTGVEQTIYLLNNIPLVRPTVVDSCILIMHDYSHFVTNDPVEIDNERGVILEERRYILSQVGWRNRFANWKYLYNDTKYSHVSLIGSEEQLKTFKPESLTNFYHKWYRPDNQALIVVGDIDVDYVENCIKNTFADIPAPETPLVKEPIPIPDNEKPIVGIITDPEQERTTVNVYWRSEPMPTELNSTNVGLIYSLMKDIVSTAMSERLNDLGMTSDAPFLDSDFSFGSECETMDATEAEAVCKDGEALKGLSALMIEAEKLRRFGLTDDEVERAKTEVLSWYESSANKADTRNNSQFISGMIYHFFRNESFMDPKAKYELVKMILPQLTAETVNQLAKECITDNNIYVAYQAPEKEGLTHPTEEQILAVIDAVKNAELEQVAGEEIPTEFLDASKLKGSKAGKITDGVYGTKVFSLKNGVRVWLLPTEKEKDRIYFSLSKEGGKSLLSDEDLYQINGDLWSTFRYVSGVSKFPAALLNKMKSGKQIGTNTFINDYYNGIEASTTVKDLETALQLAYLYYMDPRFEEDEYNKAVSMVESSLTNSVNTPDYKLSAAVSETFYDSPRRFTLTPEILAQCNLDALKRIYKTLFADAAGLEMVVVGDFNPDEIIPMISKYIGSIPKGKKAPKASYRGDGLTTADKVKDFKVQMQNPMVTVAQVYEQQAPYTVEDEARFSALRYVVQDFCTQTLREEVGGTYSPSANSSVTNGLDQRRIIQIVFLSNDDVADKLRELTKGALSKIAAEGPDAETYDKAVKNLQKTIPERRERNDYWASMIANYIKYGIEFDKDYEAAVNALTPEKVQAAAQEILKGNFIEIVMRPE